MDIGVYRFANVTDTSQWSGFIDESPQGTVFNSSTFLGAVSSAAVNIGCFKGDELTGGISVLEVNDAGLRSDMMIYSGPLLRPTNQSQSVGNQTAEKFRTVSAIVKYLSERYQNIELQTHWSLDDVRPFLWHNFGQSGPKFEVIPKFTTVVNVAGAAEPNLSKNFVYQRCSKSRRQEIRYAIKAGVNITEENDVNIVEGAIRQAYSRQNKPIDEGKLAIIKRVSKELLRAGNCKIYCARTKSGELGSLAVFAFDTKRSYYLYGANTSIARTHHTGSLVVWHGIVETARMQLSETDLEGVNSPSRGHFKLSFGGELRSYFNITYE